MQDAGWSSGSTRVATRRRAAPGEERLGHLLVSVPVMDEHRFAAPLRQRELPRERYSLCGRRGQVSEEVEPDLTHRRRPRIRRELLEAAPGCFIKVCRVVRVHPDRGRDQRGMAGVKLERGLGAREVPAGNQDANDAGPLGSVDHGLAIGVERGVLQVTV